MRSITRRPLSPLLLVAFSAVTSGCSGNSRLLIEVSHSPGLNPTLMEGRLDVLLFDVPSLKQVAAGHALASTLATPQRLFEALDLQEGRSYVVALNGNLRPPASGGSAPCDAAGGRVTGLSPPFTYRADLERLAIYIDCADAVSATGDMVEARLYHTATLLPSAAPHGQVVVAGGAQLERFADLLNLANTKLRDSIEIYDPARGSFRQLSTRLTRARAAHGASAAGTDSILFTGGLGSVEVAGVRKLVPLDSVDLYRDERLTAQAPLREGRGLHAVLPVAPGQLMVAGGMTTTSIKTLAVIAASAELYDVGAGRPGPELPDMNAARLQPATASWGGEALLVGGLWVPGVALPEERFCAGGSCGACQGPCFAPLLPGFPAGQGRSSTAAVHVPCSEGQGARGAVYVLGGKHDKSLDGSIPKEVYGDIYCVDDPAKGLQHVGQLNEPRALHTTTLVRGPAERMRIFVAGGLDAQDQPLLQAELVTVDCRCGQIAPGSISVVKMDKSWVGHTATLLPDGTVLLAGGVFGQTEAARFNPVF